ncbi:MAG: abortive infection family protein [Desulfobaccales bacterium]
MTHELISKKTRNEFREYFVGTTLRIIELEFDAADVPFDKDYNPSISGERRSLVEKYYHAVDWTKWKDVRKILSVYENVLSHLEGFTESGAEWADPIFRSLRKWIERDGYKYEDGRLLPIGQNQALEIISDTTSRLDMPEIHRQIERMKSAVDDDPSLAIGTSKELIETTCKTILEERGIHFDENADIAKLVKEARKSLGLISDTVPNSAKGAEIIRRLLSSLGNIAQGLGELRNLYGTGHGKHSRSKGLNPRHARLAVGAAATLALFLFETHQDRTI